MFKVTICPRKNRERHSILVGVLTILCAQCFIIDHPWNIGSQSLTDYGHRRVMVVRHSFHKKHKENYYIVPNLGLNF